MRLGLMYRTLAADDPALDAVERALGPQLFFHGLDWSTYPDWPLAHLLDSLPKPRRL